MVLKTHLVLVISVCQVYISHSQNISVWNFRQDNQGNSIAKAYYSGPTITQQLKDFTICFRYRISFFNTGGSGIDIFRAEDPNSKAHVHLRLFNDDYANRFEIQNAEKVKQVIWFHAEVPVRQWNSMCLIRDVKLKKFQIFQNNDLVYSYGECTTTGQLNEYFPTKVKDQPCHNQTEWYFNLYGKKNLVRQPCTRLNYPSYWCPVVSSTPKKVYEQDAFETVKWGECALSCMDKKEKSSNILKMALSSKLLQNMSFAEQTTEAASYKGAISDIFIWNRVLDKTDVEMYGNCKLGESEASNDAMMSWDNSDDYWSLKKISDSTFLSIDERATLCYRESHRIYIGLGTKENYEDAFRSCRSFGGRLPMPDDAKEEETLWRALEDPVLECNSTRIWMAITDYQEEGKFINVSRFTHTDVFVDNAIVGSTLNDERWGENQPGFSTVLNCVATSRMDKWTDNPCSSEFCVGCTIRANQQFKLRGLCGNTLFDTRYKISGKADPVTKNQFFIGQFGWYITFNNSHQGYLLSKPNLANPFAVYNDTFDYPLGLRKWIVDKNDNCPILTQYELLFTSCSVGEFTCNDGSCIPIEKRCNLIYECSDNSDEFNCQKVRVDRLAYNKDMAPVEKFSNDKRTPVELSLTDFEIVEIDYLKSEFVARFTLHMKWRDGRITFLNLRQDQNILDQDDIRKIWLPLIDFKITPSMARTKKDDVLVVEVEASMGQIEDDLTKLHEEVIFEGSANQLKSRRIYNEVFKCEFGLGHFPFDHQVCSITFALVLQQASVVKLLPNCQWRLPVTSDNEQVGEFIVNDIIVYQPYSSNQTEISLSIFVQRSFVKMFSTTYLPTFCLLILVQMTFYFPEDNFQVRATVALSCLLILSTLFGSTSRSLPTTTTTTFIEVWMMFAVLLTFLQTILQTIIGFVREKEKKYMYKVKRVAPVTPNASNILSENQGSKVALSTWINDLFGRIVFPTILGFFMIGYIGFAINFYYHDTRNELRFNPC